MPNAQILVIGYPPLFKAGPGCPLGPNSDYPIYTEERKEKAIELLTALNNKILRSVEAVKALSQSNFSRLKFVDAANSSSRFNNHDICSSEPYFYGLNLSNRTFSFHPNTKGQRAYAELIAEVINS